jgi:ribonucleotide monophosphatase NagD (HAD superfamily)
MDGTIYLDSTPIGDMINTLKICRDKGIKIYYFTNNSSKNHIEYVKKLSKIGFYDERDIVYTSAMATIGFLNSEFNGKNVYILATDEVKKSFVEAGINVVEENADIVLLAYDTTLTFEKLKKANEISFSTFIIRYVSACCSYLS